MIFFFFFFILLVNGDPSVRSFSFINFQNQSSLQTQGLPVQPANVLRLTDARANQMGIAYYSEKVLVRGFRTQFVIRISNTTAENLNGMSFVVQSEGLIAAGVGGAGLGYGDVNTPGITKGIIDSIAIEFDTHKDDDATGVNALHDPNSNHISVHSRGVSVANSADESFAWVNGTTTAINPLAGTTTTVTIEFTPSELKIEVSPLTGPVIQILNPDIANWMSVDAYGAAYVGFTASTGAASGEVFEVLSWDYKFLGVADPSKFRTYGNALTQAIAGDLSTFNVQLVDQWNNNLTNNADVTIDARLSSPPQFVVVSYQGNGLYTIEYNATLAGLTSIDVTCNGTAVQGSPFQPTILPGKTVSPNSIVWGNATSGTYPAGSQLTLTVQTRDAFGNNCTTMNDGIVLSLDDGQRLDSFTATNIAPGLYQISFAETMAANWLVNILINGISYSPPTTLVIVASTLDPSMCSTLIGTEAVADENSTIAIQLFDRFSNPVRESNVDVEVAFQRVGTRGNASSCSFARDLTNSTTTSTTARLTFGCLIAGRYSIAINAASISSPPLQPVRNSPFAVLFHAGTSLNATDTAVTSPFISSPQVATDTATFILTTFDYNGNQREIVSTNFSVRFATPTIDSMPIVVAYASAGSYVVTTSLTVAEDFPLRIFINGFEVENSPFNVSVIPGDPMANTTYIPNMSRTLNNTKTDELVEFVVQLCDEYRNNITSTPAGFANALKISLLPGSSSEGTVPIVVNIASTSNGTYAASFKSDKSGLFVLNATLNNEPIVGSPFSLVIVWAGLSNTIILVIGLALLFVMILAGVGCFLYRSLSRRSQYSEIRPS